MQPATFSSSEQAYVMMLSVDSAAACREGQGEIYIDSGSDAHVVPLHWPPLAHLSPEQYREGRPLFDISGK
eukprot:6463635-Amphidinium_carterae.1